MANGYFDRIENYKNFIKVLVGIIIALILINLLIVKGLMSIASNKTVVIQVPQVMDPGKYVITNTQASPPVYKMWARVWAEDIGNFSYKNIDKKYEFLYQFLDPQTAFKNKSEIMKFIKFVKNNFITQYFKISDIKLQKMPGGFMKITVYGSITRYIGDKKDELSGMRYSYEFVTYVRNGQIYINAIKSNFYGIVDKKEKDKLKNNQFVHFNEVIQ